MDTERMDEHSEGIKAEIKKEEPTVVDLLKKQLRLTRIMLISSLGVLVVLAGAVIAVIPGLTEAIGRAQSLMSDANEIVTQLDGVDVVLGNLAQVTTELTEANIPGMLDDINTLVASSQETIESTKKKVDEMDIDTLNTAIQDLSAVVSPLAKLFK